MGRRDRRHDGGGSLRRLWRWLPVVLVLALIGAAAASYRFDLGPRWFGTGVEPVSPAAVPPPPGLDLPEVEAPEALDPAAGAVLDPTGPQLRPAAVRRVLEQYLGDEDLGPRVSAAVATLGGDEAPVTAGRAAAVPASTTKLLTTTAALEVLGPDHVFETTVVADGPGGVVLVGGGDPLLARAPEPGAWPEQADVRALARATAQALGGRKKVRVGYDDSLFRGPAVNPRWPASYVPDGVVSPITALWVDQGRDPSGFGRVADPARSAADAFAAALADAGVRVVGEPAARRAAPDAEVLASVASAPLARIAEHVVETSDNEASEVLARHVGLAVEGRGSSTAGTAAVVATLEGLGVDTTGARVLDGSGLSRENVLTARTLVDVLRVAADDDEPDLRATLTGLPVAGFTGSLAARFEDAPPVPRSRVRAKTGTLSGVSGLAGVLVDARGTPLAFAVLADRIDLPDTLDAREALDDLAAALAACRCSTPS
ncbi:D-alanyl-D-alanine carboxypeptidase/D-alanyl-D-alanine-endopeptidase [Nocardioides sp. GCM10027113]|uniref:D-alanyl-D-alanine carboxypeptidase/D-alanyl-D-alanine endopeptidase n=1 Tax=unclassified Nocardioides TaxID=2615069 RepID=UPI00361DE6B8